jgi:hypothetical protein
MTDPTPPAHMRDFWRYAAGSEPGALSEPTHGRGPDRSPGGGA